MSPYSTFHPVLPDPLALIHLIAPLVAFVSRHVDPTGAVTTPSGEPVPVMSRGPLVPYSSPADAPTLPNVVLPVERAMVQMSELILSLQRNIRQLPEKEHQDRYLRR